MPIDTLIRGGRLIDPLNRIDAPMDLGIAQGRIVAVAPSVLPGPATRVIDASGQLVLPGLIDTHAHVFEHVTGRFGLEADLCGVRSGVTTLIDQGGPSCMTLPAFREYVVAPKRTRVFAYLSAYLVGGLEGHYYPSLYRPDCVDVEATVKAARANADIVRGIKAHAELGGFARWGLDVMRQAAEIGRRADLPLYIHFGQLWPLPAEGDNGVDPDDILGQVCDLLRPGDILAHPFTRHPGGFVDREGRVHQVVREAIDKGLKIDVGHGSHFSFRMARIAIEAGVVPDTLGADMHGYNTVAPRPPQPGTPEQHSDQDHLFFGAQRFSLVSAMSAMLALGLPLDQVVAMATCNAARIFGLPADLGHLGVGARADVSVLDLLRGRFTMRDNEGTRVETGQMLSPSFCLREGVRHAADAEILPVRRSA